MATWRHTLELYVFQYINHVIIKVFIFEKYAQGNLKVKNNINSIGILQYTKALMIARIAACLYSQTK